MHRFSSTWTGKSETFEAKINPLFYLIENVSNLPKGTLDLESVIFFDENIVFYLFHD